MRGLCGSGPSAGLDVGADMATVLGKRGAHEMCTQSPNKRTFRREVEGDFYPGVGLQPRAPLGEVELNAAAGVSFDGGAVSCLGGTSEVSGLSRRGGDAGMGAEGGVQPRGAPLSPGPEDAGHAREGVVGAAEVSTDWGSDIEHWLDVVVKEMSEGTDLADAKRRGSSMLRRVAAVRRGTSSADTNASSEQLAMLKVVVGENERLRNQLKVHAKENHILKRAVASQSAKLSLGQNELMNAKHELELSREEVHKLRAENQMISFHFQRMSSGFGSEPWLQPPHNPDVF